MNPVLFDKFFLVALTVARVRMMTHQADDDDGTTTTDYPMTTLGCAACIGFAAVAAWQCRVTEPQRNSPEFGFWRISLQHPSQSQFLSQPIQQQPAASRLTAFLSPLSLIPHPPQPFYGSHPPAAPLVAQSVVSHTCNLLLLFKLQSQA